MIRTLFWILVAVGLGAFFFAASRQKNMTTDENTLLWGLIGCGFVVIFASGAAFMLFYCWKKRVAIMVGRYGSTKTCSRDIQPFGYWCVMLFYLLAFFFFRVCPI